MIRRWLRNSAVVVVLVVFGLQEAVAQSGRSPELEMHFHRAETAWRMGGNLIEAKARVNFVLRQVPDDGEARKLRAKILLEQRRPMEALFDAQHAVYLMPENPEALLLLCEAARLSGDTHRAVRALERSIEHVREDPGLHLRLSWNALQLGRLDYAESLGRVALSLDERNPTAHLHLARVFVRKERDGNAVQVLQRALQLGVVTPAAIRQDPELAPLTRYEALNSLLR